MFIWILMLCVIFAICAGAALYLMARVWRLGWLKGIKKTWARLIGAAVVLLPAAALSFLWSPLNMVVCVLHLALFLLAADGISALARRLRRRDFRRDWAGLAALLLCAAWLTSGWVNANHVWRTQYTIETDKPVGSLRVALLSDSHMGTTFHADGFAGHLADVQAQEPDVAVFVGDFTDESTTREDMAAAAKALGALKTPCGVYFVFGNHDKNNYEGEGRAYTGEELAAELTKNGVVVLEDEIVPIRGGFCLIGRQDASEETENRGGRASMAELTRNPDENKFSIVLDHQPRDYANQAASGVDLVLSGHTHGGQMIPLVQLIRWFHLGDDNVYGLQRRGNTDFIVSSGISDWELLFKTGCRSEYVIIDIQGKN